MHFSDFEQSYEALDSTFMSVFFFSEYIHEPFNVLRYLTKTTH